MAVKRATRREVDGWWVERDNPREGVDSWSVGTIPEEAVVAKLKDRGTHQAFGVVTNAQDFMHILRLYVERELNTRAASGAPAPAIPAGA